MNLQLLRKKKLFEPPPYQQDPSASPPPDEGELDTSPDNEEQDNQGQDTGTGATVSPDAAKMFTSLYSAAKAQPPGPAEAKYSEFLNKGAPKESDYKPSKLGRLSAILGGASEGGLRGASAGIKTAKEILDDPYNKAMGRYGIESKNLEKAAEVEGKSSGRAAAFARSAVMAANAQGKTAEQAAYHQKLFEHWTNSDKNAAAAAANRGVHWSTSNVDGKIHGFKTSADGTVHEFVGPKIGQTMDEKQKSDFDKFTKEEGVRQKNRLNLQGITEAGADRRSLNTINAATQREHDTQGAITKRAKENPQAVYGNRLNKLQAAVSDPENITQAEKAGVDLNDFVEKDASGKITGLKSPTGYSRNHAADKKIYDTLWEHIYGGK